MTMLLSADPPRISQLSSQSASAKAPYTPRKKQVSQIIRRKKLQQRQQCWKVKPAVVNEADVATVIAPFISLEQNSTRIIPIKLHRHRLIQSNRAGERSSLGISSLRNHPKPFESYILRRNQQIRILKRFQHNCISTTHDSSVPRSASLRVWTKANRYLSRNRANLSEYGSLSITLNPILECAEDDEQNNDDASSKSSSSSWTSITDGDSGSCSSSLDENSDSNTFLDNDVDRSDINKLHKKGKNNRYNTVSIDSLIRRTNKRESNSKPTHHQSKQVSGKTNQQYYGCSSSSECGNSCDAYCDESSNKSLPNDDCNSTASTSDNSSRSSESEDSNSFPSTDAIGSSTGDSNPTTNRNHNVHDYGSPELQQSKYRRLSLFQCLHSSQQISMIPNKEDSFRSLSPLEISSAASRLFTLVPISEQKQLEAQLLYAQRKRQRFFRDQEHLRKQKLLEKLKERQKLVQEQLLEIKNRQPVLFQQQCEALQRKEEQENENNRSFNTPFPSKRIEPNAYNVLQSIENHETCLLKEKTKHVTFAIEIEQGTMKKKLSMKKKMKKKVKSMMKTCCNQVLPKKPLQTFSTEVVSVSSRSIVDDNDDDNNKFRFQACCSFMQIQEHAIMDLGTNLDEYLTYRKHPYSITDNIAYMQKIERYRSVAGEDGIPFWSICSIYYVLDEAMEPHCLCLSDTYFLKDIPSSKKISKLTAKSKQKCKKPSYFIIYGRKPLLHSRIKNQDHSHGMNNLDGIGVKRGKQLSGDEVLYDTNDKPSGTVVYDAYTYFPWIQVVRTFDENEGVDSHAAFLRIWNGHYFEDVAHEMSATRNEVLVTDEPCKSSANDIHFMSSNGGGGGGGGGGVSSYRNGHHDTGKWLQAQGQKIIKKTFQKSPGGKNNEEKVWHVNRIEILNQVKTRRRQKENIESSHLGSPTMSLAIRRSLQSKETIEHDNNESSSLSQSTFLCENIGTDNNSSSIDHQARKDSDDKGGWDVVIQAGVDPVIMICATVILEQLL